MHGKFSMYVFGGGKMFKSFAGHHIVIMTLVENMSIKSEQLRWHSKIYITKDIIQQKAILEKLFNINEHQIYFGYKLF